MSAHFRWYPSSEETVVPWNARYAFPSQANKALKMTPRIPPKNGSIFSQGQVIRVEFPAQGYVNPINTTLQFDVTLYTPVSATPGASAALSYGVRFQNNIQCIFNRVRLLYGATPLEDIINYNVVVRGLTEWSGTCQQGIFDGNSIADGIGGCTIAMDSSAGITGMVNTRSKFIQGSQYAFPGTPAVNTGSFTQGSSFGNIPQTADLPSGSPSVPANSFGITRRYQINFALGLFTQDKLIPTKFMASQLAVELTLEQNAACIYQPYTGGTVTGSASYSVGTVNLIPEILEFDASYGKGIPGGVFTL